MVTLDDDGVKAWGDHDTRVESRTVPYICLASAFIVWSVERPSWHRSWCIFWNRIEERLNEDD